MNIPPILIKNPFDELNDYIRNSMHDRVFILVDTNTHKYCLPTFLSFIEADLEVNIIEIPHGESNKNIEVVFQVWKKLAEFEATRKSLLMNLGGGMVTDLGGFVASTYMRGIKFINVPTTLLSQVDASVGGKTGINLKQIKNAIGAFSEPQTTLIYPKFLETLPDREFNSGLAEMLKHGLINDKNHWNKLIQVQNYRVEVNNGLISASIKIKSRVVSADLYESGLRKILNFGHTVGHAIESYSMSKEEPLLHGEAVAVGMMVESVLSYENELISLTELQNILTHLTRIFGKFVIEKSMTPELIQLMKHDKKRDNNLYNFSLLSGIGNCKQNIYVTELQIERAFELYNKKLSLL